MPLCYQTINGAPVAAAITAGLSGVVATKFPGNTGDSLIGRISGHTDMWDICPDRMPGGDAVAFACGNGLRLAGSVPGAAV